MSLNATVNQYKRADYYHSQLDEIYNTLESESDPTSIELLTLKGFNYVKMLVSALNKINVKDLEGHYEQPIINKVQHNVEFFYESADYIKKFLYGVKYYDQLLNSVKRYFNKLAYSADIDYRHYAKDEEELAKKYTAMLLHPDNIYQFLAKIRRISMGTMSDNEFKNIYSTNKNKMIKLSK